MVEKMNRMLRTTVWLFAGLACLAAARGRVRADFCRVLLQVGQPSPNLVGHRGGSLDLQVSIPAQLTNDPWNDCLGQCAGDFMGPYVDCYLWRPQVVNGGSFPVTECAVLQAGVGDDTANTLTAHFDDLPAGLYEVYWVVHGSSAYGDTSYYPVGWNIWELVWSCSTTGPLTAKNGQVRCHALTANPFKSYDNLSETETPVCDSGSYTVFDRDFNRVGGGDLPVPPDETTTLDTEITIPFPKRGPCWLVTQGVSRMVADFHDGLFSAGVLSSCEVPLTHRYVQTWIRSFNPQFGLSDVSFPNLSPFCPAFGDTAEISWWQTYNEFHARDVAVLRENSAGPVRASNGRNYDVASRASFGDKTEIPNWGWDTNQSSIRWYGTAVWRPSSGLAAGKYCLGVEYDDGYVDVFEDAAGEPGWPIYVQQLGPSFDAEVETSTGSAIEPAFGDTLTVNWEKSYDLGSVTSLRVLRSDPNGSVVSGTNQRYEEVDTLSIGTGTEDPNWQSDRNMYRWSGSTVWSPRADLPPGDYTFGVFDFSDGRVATAGSFRVLLSVYDVYTDDSPTLYVGDRDLGTTRIHYTLSSVAQGVQCALGESISISGPAAQGENVLTWDGTSGDGTYVDSGAYPVSIVVEPIEGSVGTQLQLSGVTHDASFTPGQGQTLPISFELHEPVKRHQARSARAVLAVYGSTGEPVKRLPRDGGLTAKIDNKDDLTDGYNPELFVWDGTDGQNQPAPPGTYTITLFAKDDAGAGCESPCVTTSVEVLAPGQFEAELQWPSDEMSLDDEGSSGVVMGYTDSSSGSVDYSFDGGQSGTAAVDPSTGVFSIDVSGVSGLHTATISTLDQQYGLRSISVPFFWNELSIAAPLNGDRFDPRADGDITVEFTSQAADTIDAYVVDPYYQSACIDPQQPVPAAEAMNGTVSQRIIRTLLTGQAAVAGTNTVVCDGKDASGSFVPPGVYNIVLQRSNTDGLLDTDAAVQIVVEHPVGAPEISGLTSTVDGTMVAVRWDTDVATTGCVVCEASDPDDDSGLVLRVAARDESVHHTVWLPRATPSTAYDCYVIATDPTTGASSVSALDSVTTGSGPVVGDVSLTLSPSQVEVSYSSESPVASAIEYAQVGPSVAPTQWQRSEQSNPAQEHVFTLTGLQPNAEYVYRVIGSADGTWVNSTRTEFQWFTTKSAPSEVTFTNLENGATVDAISDITVRARDAIRRFSACGITDVQLYVDGEPVESCDKNASGDYVDYAFHIGTAGLADGPHEIEAVACDDYWQETHKRIAVIVDGASGGGQAESLPDTLWRIFSLCTEPGKVQCVSAAAKLGYRAGPRYSGKRIRGSIGYLYLGVQTKDEFRHFHWRATSGLGWDYRVKNYTLPPGVWRTAAHNRAGGYAEGVPSGVFGAYLIHPSGATVKPWPPQRIREAFHIHGNWGPASKPPYYSGKNRIPIDGELYYHNSNGCIILHREDLAPSAQLPEKPKTLADCWRKYVLHGAEHGPSSIGVPLRVEYFNKQVTP